MKKPNLEKYGKFYIEIPMTKRLEPKTEAYARNILELGLSAVHAYALPDPDGGKPALVIQEADPVVNFHLRESRKKVQPTRAAKGGTRKGKAQETRRPFTQSSTKPPRKVKDKAQLSETTLNKAKARSFLRKKKGMK